MRYECNAFWDNSCGADEELAKMHRAEIHIICVKKKKGERRRREKISISNYLTETANFIFVGLFLTFELFDKIFEIIFVIFHLCDFRIFDFIYVNFIALPRCHAFFLCFLWSDLFISILYFMVLFRSYIYYY